MFYKSFITVAGLTFASTAFSTQIFNTDEHNELLKNPDMIVNLQLSGYDLSNRKQLDSLCGPGRFVGGGFSHSPLNIRVQTYFISGYSPPFGSVASGPLIVKDNAGVFYDTGYSDSAEGWEDYFDLYLESRGITDVEDEQVLHQADQELCAFFRKIDVQLLGNNSVITIVNNIINFWTKDFFETEFPEYLRGTRMKDITENFIRLMDLERESGGTWGETIDSFLGKGSIPIMTIHKSKGLEFKAVYLLALDDNTFWSFRNDPDAARRAFFVAISRAKQYLTFTFSQNRSYTRYPGRQSHSKIEEFYSLIDPFLNKKADH